MVTFAATLVSILLRLGDQDLALAQADIQQGRFSDARDLLTAEVRGHPQHAEAYNLLGISLTELHEPELAAKAFGQGLRLAPASTSLLQNYGLFCFRQADYESAKVYLAKAIRNGSGDVGARFSLAASRLRTGEGTAALVELKALETVLAQSHEYWEERGLAESTGARGSALRCFARALELDPTSLPALDGAAGVATKQGNDEQALAYLLRAHQLNPDDVPTALLFSEVCIRRDLGIDARDALERVRLQYPENSSALFLLARANVSLQNWDRASQLFGEFIRRMPGYAPAYFALGWIDLQLNKKAEARLQIEHSLRLDPQLLDARYELAQLDIDDGQALAAENNLKLILKADPKHVKANVAAADIRLRRGDVDGAQSCLQTALNANPKLAAGHYKLAAVLARKGEGERAAEERRIGTALAAQEKQEAHTQLRLVTPAVGKE